MRICPWCASQNRDDSNYCGECGKLLLPQQGPEVIWDISHGPFITCDPRVPSSEYSGFAQFIRDSGYTLDISTAQLAPDILAGKVAVVVLVTTAWRRPYSEEESALLADFVRQGGGLVACAENRAVEQNANLDMLLAPLGVSVGLSREDSPVHDLNRHPIFDAVDGIRVTDWGKISAGGSLAAIAQDEDGNVFAGAGEVGEGRIVVMGDCSMWDNHHLLHNARLASNLLAWLTKSNP